MTLEDREGDPRALSSVVCIAVFSTTDTIVAIATPPGRGGLGVVRISGPIAFEITRQLAVREHPFAARRATLTTIASRRHAGDRSVDPSGALDRAIVTTFPQPSSYTGEDVAEISAHGSPIVLRGIVEAAVRLGARLAEPGEFTLRAFLNQRLDLPQAEAVGDLIDAVTPMQARAAFDQLQGTLTRTIGRLDDQLFDLIARLEASVDFPDEGYHFIEPGEIVTRLDALLGTTGELLSSAARGRLIRDGCMVAIIGAPNVGKSSLFNALVGSDRAIVTAVAGTTRDLVSETVDVHGVQVTFVDTAGLRETSDIVESEGVSRSREAARSADLVLEVRDGQVVGLGVEPAGGRSVDVVGRRTVQVSNKADLPTFVAQAGSVPVSAAAGWGLDALRRQIVDALGGEEVMERPAITNIRHIGLLRRAEESIQRARAAVGRADGALSEEFVLADLQEARAALEEISGKRTPEDVLRHIFQRFCVGK